MTDEIQFIRLQEGETLEQALARQQARPMRHFQPAAGASATDVLQALLTASAPGTSGLQVLADRLKARVPALQQVDLGLPLPWTDLEDAETGLRITLHADGARLVRPPERSAVLDACTQTCIEVLVAHGLAAYDPQSDRAISGGEFQ